MSPRPRFSLAFFFFSLSFLSCSIPSSVCHLMKNVSSSGLFSAAASSEISVLVMSRGSSRGAFRFYDTVKLEKPCLPASQLERTRTRKALVSSGSLLTLLSGTKLRLSVAMWKTKEWDKTLYDLTS